MENRLKELRKSLKLSQQEFADRIGIKRGAVANYEIGRNTPIDAVISLICREFNVNEYWLRTGEGEMFRTKSRKEEMAEYAAKLVGGELDDFQTKLISVLAKLDADQITLLASIADKMVEEWENERQN